MPLKAKLEYMNTELTKKQDSFSAEMEKCRQRIKAIEDSLQEEESEDELSEDLSDKESVKKPSEKSVVLSSQREQLKSKQDLDVKDD